MSDKIPEEAWRLARRQQNVLARSQSGGAGISVDAMRSRVAAGKWQPMYRGVYAVHSRNPERETALWAALLRAGDGAVLSHYTAAEIHGLIDSPRPVIHITVPANRHPARNHPIQGVVIHRSDSIMRTRHPAKSIPCTRVEDTVLDIIEIVRTFDDAYGWICRAVSRGATTPAKILSAMNARKKMRWRKELEIALADAGSGVMSVLERRYTIGVERAHGLPRANRQVRVQQDTGSKYLDNLYEDYGLCVEIDGAIAHPVEERRRDKQRDNWNLAQEEIVTMRFEFPDIRDQESCCKTAALVIPVLQARAPTPLSPHPCSPTCSLQPSPPA
jgi:very-short-patch-repair endonuclease